MTSRKTLRRRRGRAIRNARRYQSGSVTVTIRPDTEDFNRKLMALLKATSDSVITTAGAWRRLGQVAGLTAADIRRMGRRFTVRRTLIHNGRKPC